jgi:hypothetical protein
MLMTVYLLKHMQAYTHILQKTGILKTFTVAKIVKKKDIDDLKALIKSAASDKIEYKKMLSEEMIKICNMHDQRNPIPGIIYAAADGNKTRLFSIVAEFCKSVKNQKFDTKELTFLISAIIDQLGLTQEDFQNLKNELEAEAEEYDDDDDDDDEYED